MNKKIDTSNLPGKEKSLIGEILRKEALEAGFEELEKYFEYLDLKDNANQKLRKDHEINDYIDDEERIMKNIEDGNGELHGL